ncbi:hypothetical protein DRO64_02755 [Candidatus Bathyarchaeota archaeon]|nr:MAG: hypothetical protein DRO64_02755 [Candidatus Bathyarchaeota archaeon]
MSLKDSLSRLFGGRENKILRLLNDYLDSIIRVINELKTLLSMVMGKEALSSPSVLDTKIEMISVYESLADDLHLESLLKICNGSFFSGLREDFIRLFDNMDDIADSAKESSQIISRSGIGKALENYSALLDPYVDMVAKTVEALGEAIKSLEENSSDAIKKSIKVKELEEQADDIKLRLIKEIFSRENDILTLIELKDFVLALDEIADAAARSSEILIMIITKTMA